MGWEERVPPVPSRQDEKDFIERYKDEMVQQSYLTMHSNEAQRPIKIQHGTNANEISLRWWRNFLIGMIVTGPLFIFPFGRTFHRMGSGVPYFTRPKFQFSVKNQHNQGRNWGGLKQQVPLWMFLSTGYAYHYTDYSLIDDEYLEKYTSGINRF